MQSLTPNQANVLMFIACCVREDGFPPTQAEISDHFGWRSVNAATEVLLALKRKGWISMKPGKVRSIKVLYPEPQGSEQ